jgi:integrase
VGKSVGSVEKIKRSEYLKTKFPGIYYIQDFRTKVKTYIARIKVAGIIDTEQIVGYSNDSIKTNPTLAYEKRNELINKIKNGESIKQVENPKLSDFFETYKEYKKHSISENKLKIYTYVFNKHVPDKLKLKKIKEIKKEDIQKIVNTMIENNYKPTSLETIGHIFSPLFGYAVELGLIHSNVAKGLKIPKFDRNRYFSLDEVKAKALYQEILKITDNQYRTMFLFLLRGRRAGEVLSLEWQHIDLKAKKYTIIDSQSKIRKTLSFVLDDELIEALECLEVKKEGIVFVSPVTGNKFYSFPKRLWKKLKENCDIEDMKLHDFRHLLGYTLVNKGVPLEYIIKALGHSKISTTQIYSNQKEQMAADAVNAYLDIMK